jgi:preprotein translocase subunit SecE
LLIFIFANLLNMNKISTYLKESYRELIEKVTWPTWLQLQQSTVIVLVATLLITGVVWVMDLVAQQALKFIYSLI